MPKAMPSDFKSGCSTHYLTEPSRRRSLRKKSQALETSVLSVELQGPNGNERIDGLNEGEQVARRDFYHGAKNRFRLDLPEKREII